jgi:hypothetical protein
LDLFTARAASIFQQDLGLVYSGCQKFLPLSIVSNVWTHAWSTKHRWKKTNCTVLEKITSESFKPN